MGKQLAEGRGKGALGHFMYSRSPWGPNTFSSFPLPVPASDGRLQPARPHAAQAHGDIQILRRQPWNLYDWQKGLPKSFRLLARIKLLTQERQLIEGGAAVDPQTITGR